MKLQHDFWNARNAVAFATAAVMFSVYGGNSAWDALYDDGYISPAQNCSWTNGVNLGWANADDPNPEKDYYIKAGQTITVPSLSKAEAMPFAGKSLVVAGDIISVCSWNKWANLGNNLTMLGGSRFIWSSVGNVTGERLTIERCNSDWPVVFEYKTRTDANPYDVTFEVEVTSDANVVLKWRSSGNNPMGAKFIIGKDWPEFYGTLHLAGKSNRFIPATFSMPGNLIVESDAVFSPTATSGNSTFGGLKVLSGATIGFDKVGNAQIITVTNKLEIEEGAKVAFNKFAKMATGIPLTAPVFMLSREAYEAGVPDMSKVVFLNSKCSNCYGDLPRIKWMTTSTDDGGAMISVSYKEVVEITNNMTWAKSPFRPTYNDASRGLHYMSDGKDFHEGVDYFAEGKSLMMVSDVYPYDFPGDSLTLANKSKIGMYGDFHCEDFVLTEGVVFRPWNGSRLAISGNMKLHKDASESSPIMLCCISKRIWEIKSNISGDEDLCIKINPGILDTASGEKVDNYSGICELKGDNSAYFGRIILDAGKAGDFKQYFEDKGYASYEPSSVSNVTLVAHGSTSLGGACDVFTFDGVTVSNQCRLALAENTVFNEPTRGWFFTDTGYLCVTNGITAKVKNTITVGGTLIKEGDGAFFAEKIVSGGETPATVEVREGTLGALKSTAFDGIALTFADGAKLAVAMKPEDESLAAQGFDGSNITLPSGKLPVIVDCQGVDFVEDKVLSVAVMTVPSASAESILQKLFVNNRPVGYACEFVAVASEDGSKATICLNMTKVGLRVIVR